MKASDYIVHFLEQEGVGHVFGYIGGMVTHLVDSIDRNPNVQFIQTYHEQTASIAAEGYALETGRFGVAICTSGPGVTNMMTGIADAYFGSVPVIFISGQVNTYEYKYDKPIRQQGFQEMDVVSMVKSVTKYAVLIDKVEDLRYELEKAVHLSMTGRRGPVVIDLPMNISRAEVNPDELRAYVPREPEVIGFDLQEVVSLVEASIHPVLLIGGGATGAERQISDFLGHSAMPVVTSLMGRGIIDESYENYVGMIGSYGNRSANMVIAKSDLAIVLGSRLDTRQTGARYQDFVRGGRIIHVDIDNDELECHRLDNRVKVNTSVIDFLDRLNASGAHYRDYTEWISWVRRVKADFCQEYEIERFVQNKAPYRLMQKLNDLMDDNDAITVDVGQNQMWAAQTIRLRRGQRFVCSGGLAPMGFSLPVAIGMSFASPHKRIICINGDGGFHMAIQSMLLISQYGLNIKVIVMNNQSLGMITQFQHLYFNDRLVATTSDGGYLVPDMDFVAKSYGFPYLKMDCDSMDMDFLSNDGPVLIDYRIEGLTTVSPKLEYDKPIGKPSPQLSEEEYQLYM